MLGHLLILGASVRAAAFSAARAGFLPLGADLFADVDLRRWARAVRVENYPEGLADAAREAPPGPWLYTGGLENYPDLVDRIAAGRPLLGNRGDVLRAVRDPRRLGEQLRAAGLRYPPVAFSPENVPCDGSWLCKPIGSSGGLGIEVWKGKTSGQWSVVSGQCFFQARIEGQPCSAVYVGGAGGAVLLGATRQLLASAGTGDAPFCYAGSVGPLRLEPHLDRQLQAIGQELARRFSLVGLFGVDLILAGDQFWVIEVNPRFPASVEVLERAGGFEAVAIHVEACRNGRLPPRPAVSGGWCGKAIVTARADLVVPAGFNELVPPADLKTWPELADVPAAGTRIRAGGPIATVLAEAGDEPSLLMALRRRAAELETAVLGLRRGMRDKG
jgi:predicted ATP-grasp superfamily ATP-dependent carboligase